MVSTAILRLLYYTLLNEVATFLEINLPFTNFHETLQLQIFAEFLYIYLFLFNIFEQLATLHVVWAAYNFYFHVSYAHIRARTRIPCKYTINKSIFFRA